MADVRLFGAFGDHMGWDHRRFDEGTLGALKATVAMDDVDFAARLDHPSTLVIVNGVLVPPGARRDDLAIAAEDEVAFAPPVSGG